MTSDLLRLAELTNSTDFELAPDSAARQTLADRLGLLGLKKLRFSGTLSPQSGRSGKVRFAKGE